MQTWVEKLITEYGKSKKLLEAYKLTLDPDNPDDRFDSKQVGGMISGLQVSMEWMRTSRSPGSRRGVDRKDAYKYCALMDMDLLPYVNPEPEVMEITNENRRQLVNVLLKLSDRERQCYLLHMAQGLSYADIGKELKLTKAAVQSYVDRARGKVQLGFI